MNRLTAKSRLPLTFPPSGDSPRNLDPWQALYFAWHAIVGCGLGLILLAAMSEITQRG